MSLRSEIRAFGAKLNEMLGIGLAGTTLLCMYWIAKNKFSEIPDALLLGALLTIASAPLVWLLALREPPISETPLRRVLGLALISIAWLVPWVLLLIEVR
jgi:hypothetical protein